MEEMFEYLIPLTGLFRKRRDPKILESYRNLEDIAEIAADFQSAESFWGDAVRIGRSHIYRKNKVTVFYTKDIVKAIFRVHGSDASDEYGTVNLTFRDGSEETLYRSPETDPQMARAVFSRLQELGIRTVIADNR